MSARIERAVPIPRRIALLIPRLATPFDGEVIATRDAIGRLLNAAGLDWCDLGEACIAPEGVGEVTPSPTAARSHSSGGARCATFGDLARAARDLDHGRLMPRERAFVSDMCRKGFNYRPSPRQVQWLDAILDSLQPRAAA